MDIHAVFIIIIILKFHVQLTGSCTLYIIMISNHNFYTLTTQSIVLHQFAFYLERFICIYKYSLYDIHCGKQASGLEINFEIGSSIQYFWHVCNKLVSFHCTMMQLMFSSLIPFLNFLSEIPVKPYSNIQYCMHAGLFSLCTCIFFFLPFYTSKLFCSLIFSQTCLCFH